MTIFFFVYNFPLSSADPSVIIRLITVESYLLQFCYSINCVLFVIDEYKWVVSSTIQGKMVVLNDGELSDSAWMKKSMHILSNISKAHLT